MICAHEIWVAAQCRPGDGIVDAVERIEKILNDKLELKHETNFLLK